MCSPSTSGTCSSTLEGTDHADADRERLDQPKAQISTAGKVEADSCASQFDEVAAVRHRARATLVSGQASDERELRSTRDKVDGATPAVRAVPESEPRIHVAAGRKPSNCSEETEPTKDRPISRDVSPSHDVGGGIARRVVLHLEVQAHLGCGCLVEPRLVGVVQRDWDLTPPDQCLEEHQVPIRLRHVRALDANAELAQPVEDRIDPPARVPLVHRRPADRQPARGGRRERPRGRHARQPDERCGVTTSERSSALSSSVFSHRKRASDDPGR